MAKSEIDTILGCNKPVWPELGAYKTLFIDGKSTLWCSSFENDESKGKPGINKFGLPVYEGNASCKLTTCEFYKRGNIFRSSRTTKKEQLVNFVRNFFTKHEPN